MAENILLYKDRPLVRKGDTIYYGYMDKPVVAIIQIKSKKEVNGQELPDKVTVQLYKTDPSITRLKEKIVKNNEVKGIYNAIELADIWLDRELK
ncbi:MAG: hypothetical protein K6B52_09715 [Clostridiales bacterium]|nr:hypothetical protein [Clostridiales bacterium]